jgi:hypothetical protein
VADLEERVRQEWPEGQCYGAVKARLGVWLEYPLVNSRTNGEVVVPVLDDTELPIRGSVVVPLLRPARRVVLLLDVSESANATTYLADTAGAIQRVSVVKGGIRATRFLYDALEARYRRFGQLDGYRPDEIGVIAFGERTWSIAEPGSSLPEALRAVKGEGSWVGEGRSDTVCALRLAEEWLRESGPETTHEILILSHGDLPDSGRFGDCSAHRNIVDLRACLERLNDTPCPSSHTFRARDGRSDVAQLFAFAREARIEDIRVSPFLFQLEHPPRFFRELARHTRGDLAKLVSLDGLETSLSSVLSRNARAVWLKAVRARNLKTGDVSANLLADDWRHFEGVLALAPGANDVEVSVETSNGTWGVLRFRIYSAPTALEDTLAKLQGKNSTLALRERELLGEIQQLMEQPIQRDLTLSVDPHAPGITAP